MQRSEKILASIVVVLLLGVVGNWILGAVREAIDRREQQILSLSREVQQKKLIKQQLFQVQEQLDQWNRQSLPQQRDVAIGKYKNWLESLISGSEGGVTLENGRVNASSALSRRGMFDRLPFTVQGRTTLSDLTTLLYRFYEAGHLHKITRLDVHPVSDSEKLDVLLAIEALALPETDNLQDLKPVEEPPLGRERLALAALEDYRQLITERNLFAPFNQPPQIQALGTRRAPRTQQLRVRLQADDPDGEESALRFAMLEGPPGARISSSGEFTWRPSADEELARREVSFQVTDAGTPPQTAEGTFAIQVEEAPPPPPERPTPRGFDHARFAKVVAMFEVDRQPLVWVNVQTTGKLLKLRQGEESEVGYLKFRIEEIDLERELLTISAEEQTWAVRLGESLTQPDD